MGHTNGTADQMERVVVMRALIVIPTYNERENITTLLGEVFAAAPATDAMRSSSRATWTGTPIPLAYTARNSAPTPVISRGPDRAPPS